MTNKEKAIEIKNNSTAVLASGEALNTLIYNSVMNMAKWKDAQFRETMKLIYKIIRKFRFECPGDDKELIYLIKEALNQK